MKTIPFNFTSLPFKVHFGEGVSSDIVAQADLKAGVFIISEARNESLYRQIRKALGEENTELFTGVKQHVPFDLVKTALKVYQEANCTSILAIGGGSAIGLAKAIALEIPTSIVAVPTTYAGSEMTNIWGITGADGNKKTGRDDRVMARHIFYDPSLTSSLPSNLAVTSSLNALAHLIEAAYSPEKNPITYQVAMHGITQSMKAFQLFSRTGALDSQSNALFCQAAFLGGKCLSEVPMSLHHKAAHVLGGSYDLEHSHVHTVLLPHVLEFQWNALDHSTKEDFKNSMSHDYPPQAILNVINETGAPKNLQEIGYDINNLQETVGLMLKNPYKNPQPLTEERLNTLVKNAFEGKLTGIK